MSWRFGERYDPLEMDACLEVFDQAFSFDADNLNGNPELPRNFWKTIRIRVRDNAAGKYRA